MLNTTSPLATPSGGAAPIISPSNITAPSPAPKEARRSETYYQVKATIFGALIEAINKHNDRNPDSRIVYLNCGAVATELTNDQCSFWHFRFDLNVAQKAEVMVAPSLQTEGKGLQRSQQVGMGQ